MSGDSKPYTVYILRCCDETFYTGITTELERRIQEHNDGIGAKYTRSRGPVELVYQEQHPDRSSASKREYEIKLMSRLQKLSLMEQANSLDASSAKK